MRLQFHPNFCDEHLFSCVLSLFWSPFHHLIFNPEGVEPGQQRWSPRPTSWWWAGKSNFPASIHLMRSMGSLWARGRRREDRRERRNGFTQQRGCLLSVGEKLSSVCLRPDNRDWTGLRLLWSTQASFDEIQHTDTHTHIHISAISNACVYSDVTQGDRETHCHSCHLCCPSLLWSIET